MRADCFISPGSTAARFDVLLLRELTKVELIDPWRMNSRAAGAAGRSLLAGAMALHFGDMALICMSPLRYSHSNQGTQIAASTGDDMLSLGYRINVVDTSDTYLVLPSGSSCLTMTTEDMRLRGLLTREPPIQLLQGVHAGQAHASIQLRLLGVGWCQLTYRPELDGAIEFAPVGTHHQMEAITVSSPNDEFGWLHPASPYPFALNDRCWRSADPGDWPWPLRKALQSHHEPAMFYRDTLCQALTARFRQTSRLRQRLLALRYPAQVKDVPDGLIEEIAQASQRETH